MTSIDDEAPRRQPEYAKSGPPEPAEAAIPSPKGERDNTRHPERTRAAILAAAVHEFAEAGYAGARVDAVAERAGSNKRMIYHYFGNKDALYMAVLEDTYRRIREAEHALRFSDLEPVEAITALVRFTWRYYNAHPEFLRVINHEDIARAGHLKASPAILAMNSPLIARIADVLDRGRRSGVFRADIDPLDLYISIAALGFFYLSNRWTLAVVFGRDLGEPERLAAWEAHMITATLAILRPA